MGEIYEISQNDGKLEIEFEQDNHSYFTQYNPRYLTMQVSGSEVNLAIGKLYRSDIYGRRNETWTCYASTISSRDQMLPVTFAQWNLVFSGGGFSGYGHQYETLELYLLEK